MNLRERLVFDPSAVEAAVNDDTTRDTPGVKSRKKAEKQLRHDCLWRIQRAAPPPGYIGVFNRSQYEDVLIVRVHDLVPPEEWEQRYDLINAWEAKQVAAGVTFVKVFLHISKK